MNSMSLQLTSSPKNNTKKLSSFFKRPKPCWIKSKLIRSRVINSYSCWPYIIWPCVIKNWAFLKNAPSVLSLASTTERANTFKRTSTTQNSLLSVLRCSNISAKLTCRSVLSWVKFTSIKKLYITLTMPSRSPITFWTSAKINVNFISISSPESEAIRPTKTFKR